MTAQQCIIVVIASVLGLLLPSLGQHEVGNGFALAAEPGIDETGPLSVLSAPTPTPPQTEFLVPDALRSGTEELPPDYPAVLMPPEPPVELQYQFQDQGLIDKLHGEITSHLLATAEWMDSFFADESSVKEENRTYMRFRYEIFREERAKATFKPAVDLRLALPQLERKTHLVFSTEPAVPSTGPNAPVGPVGERLGIVNQERVTTAIQYIFRTTPQESVVTRAGLQFSNLKPVIFLAPRYRLLLPFSDWNIRFTQEVLWRSSTGWQEDTRLDFERQIFFDLFFRTTVDGFWSGRADGYLYSLSFTVRQPLDESRALDYEWINIYNTRPVDELSEIAFRIRYRQSFVRPWIFFDIAPQLRLPRTNNFDAIPGILFKFEMFFGRPG